jgi:glutaconate CoA-transferase subunit A
VHKQEQPEDAVKRIKDGMVIGIGGWGARRKPMSLVRALLRSKVKDLTVVSYGGPDVGMLCAAGKIKKLIFGFVSLDVIPLEAYFRKAREQGQIEIMELDEGMLQWGLRAAAQRLPFLPTRAGLGSDIQSRNPELKTVRSPYGDGESLLAMPALRLDVALLHVNHADERGNTQIFGPDPFFDEWFARAADTVIASCEKLGQIDIGEQMEIARACMPIERSLVHSVVASPYGAHPTSCAPDYGIDLEHLKEYSASAREKDGWAEYSKRHVFADEMAYLNMVGGEKKIRSLPLPVF